MKRIILSLMAVLLVVSPTWGQTDNSISTCNIANTIRGLRKQNWIFTWEKVPKHTPRSEHLTKNVDWKTAHHITNCIITRCCPYSCKKPKPLLMPYNALSTITDINYLILNQLHIIQN